MRKWITISFSTIEGATTVDSYFVANEFGIVGSPIVAAVLPRHHVAEWYLLPAVVDLYSVDGIRILAARTFDGD